jgi:SHS2 domain-containing protein
VPLPFEIIEHPADVGFIARGQSFEELFANAALALCSLACDVLGIEERERREIEVSGSDHESLLFAWLAEILAISDAEQIFFRRAQVSELAERKIRGAVFGERFDAARHRAGTYIKAVTFHQLRVERAPGGWRAQVYLDV